MLRCLVIALFVLASGSASAQTVRLEQYRHPSEPKFEVFNHLYLKGVLDGFIAYAVALKANATWQDFRSTVALHPTIAEELVTLK